MDTSSCIYINSSNHVAGNTFQVNLPCMTDLTGYKASVDNMFIYYSWYNISAALGNNQFEISIPRFSGTFTTIITIPDGAYQVSTLNDLLQYWFIQNGFYALNNVSGIYTYYGALQVSPSSYSIQWTTYAIPSGPEPDYTYGFGWTISTNGDNLPIPNQSMQLTILPDNGFKNYLGYEPGTYPSTPTLAAPYYTTNSTSIPDVNPIGAVQCRLSCVYNALSQNSTLLHTFTNGGVSVGGQIDASPKFYQPVPCNGAHKTLTLSLFDVSGNPLGLLDPNVSIKIMFSKV